MKGSIDRLTIADAEHHARQRAARFGQPMAVYTDRTRGIVYVRDAGAMPPFGNVVLHSITQPKGEA